MTFFNTDSTTIRYFDFDSYNNWTRAIVDYKGILRRHNHVYTVFRQITYDGESTHAPLINLYEDLNPIPNKQSNTILKTVGFGTYGFMTLPSYMEMLSQEYINQIPLPGHNYNFSSTYKEANDDAYATFSSTVVYDGNNMYSIINDPSIAERNYNKDWDEDLETIHSNQLNKVNNRMLKWLPYQISDISGKRALKIRYYRYGNPGPIPVYCETYQIPMGDGYILTFTFSFQSNLYHKFYNDFLKSINSIQFL